MAMAEAALLEDSLSSQRSLVNRQLSEYIDQLGADCPARLRDAMSYSLLGGGKRLRPLLTLLACETAGGDAKAALPAACAVEMIHTYSLIHDDLPAMDDDSLRRGRPTCHIQFGEAHAILAGDALLTLAFEVLARDVRPACIAAACCADLASAAGACGMVAGQTADFEAEGSGVAGIEQLQAIHLRKTGRLLRSALTMGGRIAEASSEALASLSKYGENIGLAFQITDDLLDIVGEQEKMGKGVRKDAKLGKLTYPFLLGIQESRKRARSLIAEACSALSGFGEASQRLEALAHFVLERDH
jgi:geranylgeranyl diphosphate synthase, type II